MIWTGKLKDGKPHSDWEDLPTLQASAGRTALAGQVLDLFGVPLADVTLEVEDYYGGGSRKARTDETGRFLVEDLEVGSSELVIDGREARRLLDPASSSLGPHEDHGVF
jgi:hypothetical protein